MLSNSYFTDRSGKRAAKSKDFDRIIYFFRVLTSVLIVGGLIITAYFNVQVKRHGNEEDRAKYLDRSAEVFGYIFLMLTIILAVSITTLVWMLHKKYKMQ